MSNEIPFPIPLSVILSPSHKMNIVPAVRIIVDEIVKNNGASVQAAEDVTFGGQTYKQVKWLESADYGISLVGKTPKGVIEIILSKKLTLDNPDVKAILESISFKE